jgi:hypothetical protein
VYLAARRRQPALRAAAPFRRCASWRWRNLAFRCWSSRLDTWRHASSNTAAPPAAATRSSELALASETLDHIFVAPLLQVRCAFLPVVLLGMGLPALVAAATSSARRCGPRRVGCFSNTGSSAVASRWLCADPRVGGRIGTPALLSLGLDLGARREHREMAGAAAGLVDRAGWRFRGACALLGWRSGDAPSNGSAP